jgi:transcriptional regulator with PAS, ATPase and Fis domain
VANSSLSVLLLGETGVGKEVTAEAIHLNSPRANKPLLRLNCAAFSEHLLESELFGHEKGAFTGAEQAKPGLLEVAIGGTVFLDEVGELPLTLQAKLLRVFEQQTVMRVGGLKERAIDVRFIAATNRDLNAEIALGRFRRDLFFRLNGFSLSIAPLRERKQEIEPLAQRFLAEAALRAGRSRAPRLSPAALALLQAHSWPGNIRELRNLIERGVVLCAGDVIETEHLPLDPITPGGGAALEPASSERDRLVEALQRAGGNQSLAAKALGISRGTLLARLDAFGVPRPRKRPHEP